MIEREGEHEMRIRVVNEWYGINAIMLKSNVQFR